MEKPKNKQKKRMRFNPQKLRRNVILLGILGCLALIAFLGYSIFLVSEIEVEGNIRFNDERIAELSGIRMGDNVLMVRESDVRKAIEAEPYLTFVKLERVLPDKIVIHVAERDAIAAVQTASGYALLYIDGTVLQVLDDPDGFILLKGVEASAAVLGKKAEGIEAYRMLCMERVLQALSDCGISHLITSIDLTMPIAIRMETQSGIAVQLGNTDRVTEQMEKVKVLLPQLIREGKTGGTVDASGTTGVSYIPE